MDAKVVCMECHWEVSGSNVTEIHEAGLHHSYMLDTGDGHGPVLFTADVWDWRPELWPDIDRRTGPERDGGSFRPEPFDALEKVWPLGGQS